MLLLIFLLVFIANITDGIQLSYIVKKDKHTYEPRCIAEDLERYAALGWVYPLPVTADKIPNITTTFIPQLGINKYDCQFSTGSSCIPRWNLRDWKIDSNSYKTKEFISDRRWEDLPTVFISQETKEFSERFELDNFFNYGLSVRANGTVEILACAGWDPYNYPCYYFIIENDKIQFIKYSTLPRNLTVTNSLEYYKEFKNILIPDEWRNFILSYDKQSGIIELIDAISNRTLISYTDNNSLVLSFLFVRTNGTSLWKFHKNDFLFTKTTQISRLGPRLTTFSNDLCVSLLVKLCKTCSMQFFYQNGTIRKKLAYIGPIKDDKWKEIKLKEENVQLEHINIFVETSFTDTTLNQTTGFWAIDDVRICHENEVKVSILKIPRNIEQDLLDEKITCQIIEKPNWRPKKKVYDEIKEFPLISAVSSSNVITLSWAKEDVELEYFITYQANDICKNEPYNPKRNKSNGFIVTKYNEITIERLVPYTLYNFSIFTALHRQLSRFTYHTLETDKLTIEEIPKIIHIKTSPTTVRVTWEKVNCVDVYGHIVHKIIVKNKNLKFKKELSLETTNEHEIKDLQPFTPYTLEITTARNSRSLYSTSESNFSSINFTTNADLALPPEHLELYSVDEYSASLRFNLQAKTGALPETVQINKCNALSSKKCRTFTEPIKHCTLWPNKYCIDVNYLIPHQKYILKVSIKNKHTPLIGNETDVEAFTTNRVPAPPKNITFKMVDCNLFTEYCHLNLSWLHPYNQNGTITSFDIILNSTGKYKDSGNAKFIHEVYKVNNKTYLPIYYYQIKFIPYSSHYNLYLQSSNIAYKSYITSISIKTDDLGEHIDQSPKLLEKSASTMLFKIPHLDRRLDFYKLTVVVQDFNKTKPIDATITQTKKIADNLCHNFGDTWIASELKIENNDTANILISSTNGKEIKSKTKYCLIFIITNSYKGLEHDAVYYQKLETSDIDIKTSTSYKFHHLYLLLILLLLVPIGFLLYRYLRKKKVLPKSTENNENEYESLPFEETNCVNNDSYDQLRYK